MIFRVTERVAPKVGMKAECLPAPPVTMTMMSRQSRAIRNTAAGDLSWKPSG